MNKFQCLSLLLYIGENSLEESLNTRKFKRKNNCLIAAGCTVSGVTQKYLFEYDKGWRIWIWYCIWYITEYDKGCVLDVDLLWELAFPPPQGTKSKDPVYYTWAGWYTEMKSLANHNRPLRMRRTADRKLEGHQRETRSKWLVAFFRAY